MPRRSAVSLTVPRVDGRPAPLAAPSDLPDAAAKVWRGLTASTPTDHFRASDVPVLRTYCVTAALLEEAEAELAKGAVVDGKVSPWVNVHERLSRTLATLALRLRLCPSARQDPKSTGRQKVPSVPNVDFSKVKQ